jgi:flagellar hook assembly protein FlgD
VSLPDDATHVSLVVYDLLGQPVKRLIDGPLNAGTHLIRWDGTNDRGTALSSGVYVYRLRAGGTAAVGRVVMVR